MANLIIKSSADDLVLKGSGGSSAITVGSTGTTTFAENATLSGTANVYGQGTFPAGHIIQTQFRGFSGPQVIGNGSSGGNTFTNIGTGVSGQEFTIDMAVASGNKIVGFGHVNLSASARYAGLRIFADSTQIALGDAWDSRKRMTVACQNDDNSSNTEQHVMSNSSFSFNYTPASTSTITYTVKAASPNDATTILYINRIEADTNAGHVHTGYSSLILMEVKA